MVFQEATSEPTEKAKNWHHDIWCLIANTQANRVAIVNSAITKIFNPCKHWTVKIQHSVLYVQWISVYSYSLPVFHCLSVVWFSFVSVLLCLNNFVRLFCVRLFFFTHCIFLFLYWNCIPGISISITTTIWQVNKHQTSDSAIFCLSIGSKSQLPSQTLMGYLQSG